MFEIAKKKASEPVKEGPPAAVPPLDVYENDAEFLVVADLPGVAQGAADVTLHDDRLVLQANGVTRRYHREILVPPSIDAEQVSAAMKSGVLTVHLPKRAAYRPRQIQVRGA